MLFGNIIFINYQVAGSLFHHELLNVSSPPPFGCSEKLAGCNHYKSSGLRMKEGSRKRKKEEERERKRKENGFFKMISFV